MPKARAKKKDASQEQRISKGEQSVDRTRTRQSMAAAETPNTIYKTPKSTKKLSKDDIEYKINRDSDDESANFVSSEESIGKNENDIFNDRITVKIGRMSDKETFKIIEYKLGTMKEDHKPLESTRTLRQTRNRKSIHQCLREDKLLQTCQDAGVTSISQSKRKNIQNILKTPTKRPPNQQSEWESLKEVDENIMLNANLSPKRSKVVKSKQIANTPTNVRSAIANTQSKVRTPKKSIKSSPSLSSPTKAFSNLQIETPRSRKSVKLSEESNKIKQDLSKRYEFRTKRNNAMYSEYSSNSESGDDGDKDYDSKDCSDNSEDEDEEDDASDNSDMYTPKRPKSTKKVPNLMRTPSKTNLSPTKLISRMSLNSLTPSVHRRTMNIIKPSTPLQEARQKLHVSVLPKSLPCREEEFNNIYSFLHTKLSDLSGGCIYVSGVPGTGKTATVNEVIRCLKKSVNAGKLNEFEFVEVNGMKLSEPRQAYVQIWKQLSGNQATWEVAQKSLHNRFTTADSKRGMTLLLVDELDLLCTKRQDVVYNLLDWPSKSTAKLVVVTIANTMDLPERILIGKVTSRLGLTRLTFPPYSHKQLEEIVVSRLKGHNAFSGETIQLVARKVAAVSGDARRALDICRRATEVAEMNDREIVTMMDVKKALDEMIASPKIQAIKACSDLEKIFLQAVCSEVNRTGVEEVLFKNVYYQLETLCTFEGERLPNVTEALSMCARLGAWRLLLCDHSRLDIHQRLLLNVSTDDVYFAIKTVKA